MSNHPSTQPTWREIALSILVKSKDDYQTTVKPVINTSRIKLGAWLQSLGKKIQA